MSDLFDHQAHLRETAPLAERLRPRCLDEYIGQEHLLGPGRLLRRAIEADRLGSLVFYGPPGSGKTTLARIIAGATSAVFIPVSAVTAGVKELRRVIQEAGDRRKFHRQRTIIFVDECHALNKAQQDVLLPAVEDGTLVFIGATTENPYFEMNSALLSRSRVFELQPLDQGQILTILEQALRDNERGLGTFNVLVDQGTLAHLADLANGDARTALNALELAVLSTPPDPNGKRLISLATVEDSIQRRAIRYDKSGDQHYDVLSAFIKSIRGSDPDAALYWYARMTQAGENQRLIVRRMIVHASEDIGLADPVAMLMAHAAAHALEHVGMPEARIPIAQCIIYLATAPKSNSVVTAINAAMRAAQEDSAMAVPPHLRDTSYPGAKKLGHTGYKYPHDYPGHWVPQQYLPDNLVGRHFYTPSGQGREKNRHKS